MPFAAALSTATPAAAAVDDVLSQLAGRLPGPPDLAVCFVSPTHAESLALIAATLADSLQTQALIGCIGEGVAGTGREVEQGPAVSLWLAHWGGRMAVEPFALDARKTPDGPSLFGLPDATFDGPPTRQTLLVLGDPYTFPAAELLLPRINDDRPGLRVFGGMASGSGGTSEPCLMLGAAAQPHGAVGVLLTGEPPVRGIVSQGCRPVGPLCEVTAGRQHIIAELDGEPALARIQAIIRDLPEYDRPLFKRGAHVGFPIDRLADPNDPGECLIRNLVGIDPDTGAVAVADRVTIGTPIQFQVRDGTAASDELVRLLRQHRNRHPAPSGALLFTCNGRGSRLFTAPNHDAAAIAEYFGAVPLAGFFAAGEIGPIGGQNYLHGFTASVALFEE